MQILRWKFIILFVVIGLPWLGISACVGAFGGDQSAVQISNNNRDVALAKQASDERMAAQQSADRLAAAQAKAAADTAAAQARADSKMHGDSERTQQVLLTQQGANTQLMMQSQHLITVRAMQSENFQMFLLSVIIVAALGGAVYLMLYFRNNPRPMALPYGGGYPNYGVATIPHDYQLGEQASIIPHMSRPVPYAVFMNDPSFRNSGWVRTAPGQGQRIVNNQVVATCTIMEG